MPNKALSERIKRARKASNKEVKLQEAINTYTCEQEKPPHLQKGADTVASEFGIESQYKTIRN